MAARIIAGRERPYSEKGPWKFTIWNFDNEVQSFPSGHTTVAFALSTVLAEHFGTVWSRIGFYGFASLTAYARVLNNQHWFSDVIVGALIGISGGIHVLAREESRNNIGEHSSLSVYPSINGISLIYKF